MGILGGSRARGWVLCGAHQVTRPCIEVPTQQQGGGVGQFGQDIPHDSVQLSVGDPLPGQAGSRREVDVDNKGVLVVWEAKFEHLGVLTGVHQGPVEALPNQESNSPPFALRSAVF